MVGKSLRIRDILKTVQKKPVGLIEFIWLMTMKIRLKMKNRSQSKCL